MSLTTTSLRYQGVYVEPFTLSLLTRSQAASHVLLLIQGVWDRLILLWGK